MEQITLLELNNLIRNCITERFSRSYWVIAEISEIRLNQRGHCYLELVEKKEDEILAKMRATIWSYAYRNISGWFESMTGESLKAGISILANVQVNFHEIFGLSLNIRDIDPRFTLGERARRRQEILLKLQQDGIAEMNRELPLPMVPQRVALIASPTSAGYQDFMEQLSKNPFGYHFRIKLFSAIMQGREAEGSLIGAMLAVNETLSEFDVLVIIRGGGATLDLDCFDSYELACHVAQFPIPVITGIGHERDETIIDLVANTRMKTPTAAAEFLIAGCRQYDEKIEELFAYIADYSRAKLREEIHRIDEKASGIRYLIRSISERNRFHLSRMNEKLRYTVRNRTGDLMARVGKCEFSMGISLQHMLMHQKTKLNHLEARLDLLNPHTIMNRGFSVTRFNNRVIKDITGLKPADIIETEFSKGKIKSRIIQPDGKKTDLYRGIERSRKDRLQD